MLGDVLQGFWWKTLSKETPHSSSFDKGWLLGELRLQTLVPPDKESAFNAGDLGSILDWEDPLEKGKATHCSILAWRISRTVQSMGSPRVGHD